MDPKVKKYLNALAPTQRDAVLNVRDVVKKIVPEAIEIFAYNMPAFKYDGKPLMYYAAFTHHLGIYPLPHVLEALKNDLAPFKKGKGSIQFPLEKPIPLEIIEKIVIARMKEITG